MLSLRFFIGFVWSPPSLPPPLLFPAMLFFTCRGGPNHVWCDKQKNQAKIMAKASETGNVVECAANEMLRTSLPVREKNNPNMYT